MLAINPYLNFNGNCEEVFELYKSVFGGDFTYVGRYKEMRYEFKAQLPESEYEKIMHISLPISKDNALMGSDSSGAFGGEVQTGNNISISVHPKSREEADRIYNELSAGGIQAMPMNDTFWGDYFGMLTDKFGINWMVNYSENKA